MGTSESGAALVELANSAGLTGSATGEALVEAAVSVAIAGGAVLGSTGSARAADSGVVLVDAVESLAGVGVAQRKPLEATLFLAQVFFAERFQVLATD